MITTPTVHMNGTSRDALQEQFENAYKAAGKFLDVIKEACPNARDYYVQGDGAFTKARDEHYARLKKVQEIREEYLALFQATEED
jgi:hypothetical protein